MTHQFLGLTLYQLQDIAIHMQLLHANNSPTCTILAHVVIVL